MISVNSAKRFKWQRALCLNVTVTVKCTLHQSAAIISVCVCVCVCVIDCELNRVCVCVLVRVCLLCRHARIILYNNYTLTSTPKLY